MFLIILSKRLQTIHICCYKNKRYWVVLAVEPFYFVGLTLTYGKNALLAITVLARAILAGTGAILARTILTVLAGTALS